jgi:NAD(P)H-hydrate epimerase
MKISSVQQMREMDQQAIGEFGITEELLMENAGNAAFFAMQQEYDLQNKKILIFCGIGNNGGDGFVVARKLHSRQVDVQIVILGDPAKFKGSTKINYDIIQKLPVTILQYDKLKTTVTLIRQSDIIIDALFGTGLDREVQGSYKKVIELINTSRKKVVSLDIPSGIHGDIGQVLGCAVQANITVTFGLPKTGNLLYPGYAHCGKLYCTHISFPPELYNRSSIQVETNNPLPLPVRKGDAHKGNCGKVLFIAGSANYMGAPYFAAQSFLKSGGGLSFLATPEKVSLSIGKKGREIVFLPQKETEKGSMAKDNKKFLLDYSRQVDLVVIGPGLSLHPETQQLVRDLVPAIRKSLLIDGDGLTAVAGDLAVLKRRKAPTILTPHPGEMCRLTGISLEDLDNKRIRILQKTAKELNSSIVLKGAHSLIGFPDGRVFINLSGNPGMATAGSGDVLTGTIAAMYGLGFSVPEALRMGVFMHGLAGDLAAGAIGQDGLVAGDIMARLPDAMKAIRTQFDEIYADYYNSIFII